MNYLGRSKKKIRKPSWFVYRYDCNHNTICKYDVLSGREDTLRDFKKRAKSYGEFCELLRGEMMYRFWSKFEHEITVARYPYEESGDAHEKIDVFDQLMLNWDSFCGYCWMCAGGEIDGL